MQGLSVCWACCADSDSSEVDESGPNPGAGYGCGGRAAATGGRATLFYGVFMSVRGADALAVRPSGPLSPACRLIKKSKPRPRDVRDSRPRSTSPIQSNPHSTQSWRQPTTGRSSSLRSDGPFSASRRGLSYKPSTRQLDPSCSVRCLMPRQGPSRKADRCVFSQQALITPCLEPSPLWMPLNKLWVSARCPDCTGQTYVDTGYTGEPYGLRRQTARSTTPKT